MSCTAHDDNTQRHQRPGDMHGQVVFSMLPSVKFLRLAAQGGEDGLESLMIHTTAGCMRLDINKPGYMI